MKRLTAALLILTLALGLAACGTTAQTETIYVQTQSLRTLGGQEIRSEYTYSPKGTPLTVKTYFNDTLYQSVSTRTTGNTSYQTVVDRSGNETTQTATSTYDEQGNLAMLEISVATNTVSRTTYTYDEQNRLTKASTVTSLGNTTLQYTYDSQGNLVEQIKDDQTANTYVRTTYTYNDRNYVTEEMSYDKDGVLQSSTRYTYEDGDTGRTATIYDGEGKPTGEVIVCNYDEHGHLIRETTSVDGEVLQTIVNTYEAMEVPVE